MDTSDVVIVGGGIGGSALAAALAADGRDVVVLEQSEVYEDRVRGESMMPWGGAEARALGIELERAPVLNHVAGLLLADLVDVEDDHDFLAGEGALFMAGFHQGNGRARVYLCPGLSEADRYVGPGDVERFLADCAFEC